MKVGALLEFSPSVYVTVIVQVKFPEPVINCDLK